MTSYRLIEAAAKKRKFIIAGGERYRSTQPRRYDWAYLIAPFMCSSVLSHFQLQWAINRARGMACRQRCARTVDTVDPLRQIAWRRSISAQLYCCAIDKLPRLLERSNDVRRVRYAWAPGLLGQRSSSFRRARELVPGTVTTTIQQRKSRSSPQDSSTSTMVPERSEG